MKLRKIWSIGGRAGPPWIRHCIVTALVWVPENQDKDYQQYRPVTGYLQIYSRLLDILTVTPTDMNEARIN